jgi:hypothetical protein
LSFGRSLLGADSDEAGQVFYFEADNTYRFEAGHCTEAMSASWRRFSRVEEDDAFAQTLLATLTS